MADSDSGLFDFVPWNYGFVHTGMLAWLLEQPEFRRLVLDAVVVEDKTLLDDDFDLAASPRREDKSMGAACDLGVSLVSSDRSTVKLAIETKVEDQLRTDQLAGYDKADLVVAYLPGLTGFLAIESRPMRGSGTLTGKALSEALQPVRGALPPVIGSYVDALAEEADWFEQTVAELLAGVEPSGDPPNTTSSKFAHDIAWVVALQRELKGRSECPIATDFMYGRVVAWDHGFFWGETHERSGSLHDLSYFVDAVAPKMGGSRSIIIKAGFRDKQTDEAMSDLHAFAVQRGAPEIGEWKRGQRRFKGETVGCWKVNCADLTVSEAADCAISAATWIVDTAEGGIEK